MQNEDVSELAGNWYELRAKAAQYSRVRALGPAEHDPDGLARKRRGQFGGERALHYEWAGTAAPPDLVPVSKGADLISRRMLDRMVSAGIRGLGDLPVGLKLPDSSVADYALLVVKREVESICFRRSDHTVNSELRMYALRDPVIRGLDGDVSDAYILPYDLGLHSVIVSTRFMEIAERARLTNIEFIELRDLEVILPDPDQVLC